MQHMRNFCDLPSSDETGLWLANTGSYTKDCLYFALEANLFEIVKSNEPMTRAALIEKCGFGTRGGNALINVLAASNYLKAIDEKYYLTDTSENYLLPSSQFYWGTVLQFQYVPNKATLDAWELDKAAQKEKESLEMWANNTITIEEARNLAALLQSFSYIYAIEFAKKINLKEKFAIDTILDIGGGSGCFSVAIVKNQPQVKAVILDLPIACQVCQEYIQNANIPDGRIKHFACNMFTEDLPKYDDPSYGYSGVLLSNVLHDWSVEQCEMLCKKVYDALPSNGTILIHEGLLNDDGNGPLLAALFSFDMFISSPGQQFSFSEIKEMLKKVGFSEIGIIPTRGIYYVIHGKKI